VEETWKRISIAGVEFHVQKLCGRCKVTTIVPEKGEFGGDQPLATLKSKNSGNFGVDLVHTTDGFGSLLSLYFKQC